MYNVKVGDTLHRLAYQHNIRVRELLNLNPQLFDERSYIQPGNTLYIPTSNKLEEIKEKRGECLKEFSPLDVEKYMNKWKKYNHNSVVCENIGYSVMKFPLQMVKIGTGANEIFYSGGWHSNEWMTSKFLTEWADDIIEALVFNKKYKHLNVKELFEKITLYIVPMVNPDGILLVQQGNYQAHPYYGVVKEINKGSNTFDHWSANIRGVDLNHQWPAGWKIEADESPSQAWPRHYSGIKPLTEPEAKTIYRLTKQHDFTHVLTFHSQGQLIYWGYRELEPEVSKTMAHRLSLKSSYLPVRTADSDAGYKDWFIQETGRPGFTIEVGVGTNPLPFHAYGEIWSNNTLLAIEGLLL
ncbi:M14 family metallopeptidase [Bacillus shivajii]|uniref:M14 family metallopeptidase n=1 Tax=Bacillus shivajii TaxID=1983719 RepID=UPI001CF949C7|nr:M14 family metallopeptidase [Bacillus shivajii]UCZ55282.1 M14 family metallopeptidase [Bacillus shivajii]